MKNYITLFIILTTLTGLIGFAGMNFYGVEAVRIAFLIFADLLVVSLIAKLFFPDNKKMRLERIKK